ncbi:class I SAM-dependent methyltransferase [Marivirga arenosa]|uniref:Class I SAM-dependent methyltransferase n=1 Tax=Marivirga arenosa TaxID=3059076 RepID=A0AA49GGW5_9BACT|nr:class I SAM-dependent methyltransferase [Marivirga sp. BKB1-2]WKK82684.2 class I SAM-dependent methyltransferase [Marivirga sp. BKB1-2]
MNVAYDQYYQTENYFGEPYPELIQFMQDHPEKGKVLDLGCGQGRDAIALARLGYVVTGIDNSKVGIDQMLEISRAEKLKLEGQVGDIYSFDGFNEFDIILLDSMFHFAKEDREKEIGFLKKIVANIKKGGILICCMQDAEDKVKTFKETIDTEVNPILLVDKAFPYLFEDSESGQQFAIDYRMMVLKI